MERAKWLKATAATVLVIAIGVVVWRTWGYGRQIVLVYVGALMGVALRTWEPWFRKVLEGKVLPHQFDTTYILTMLSAYPTTVITVLPIIMTWPTEGLLYDLGLIGYACVMGLGLNHIANALLKWFRAKRTNSKKLL